MPVQIGLKHGSLPSNRKVDDKPRPRAGRRLHHHGPAVVLGDDEIRHREPQSRTHARRLRGEERLEGAPTGFRVHPRAVILHFQSDVAAAAAEADGDARLFRARVEHRVRGVFQQVE